MTTIRTTDLERKLGQQSEPQQRLLLINELASTFVYTNVRKAQRLLAEQLALLEQFDLPDLRLTYHLNTAIIENQLYNYYLAEIHFKKALEIIEERGDIQQQAETYIDYAGTCMNLEAMEKAVELLEKSIRLLNAYPDDRLQARITCRQGYLHLHYADNPRAIELLLEAEKCFTLSEDPLTLKDHYFLTLIHSGLGKIYERNNDNERCVRAYLNVVNRCESMDMRTRMSWHYLNVGNSFMSLQDLDSAETYFKKAIRIKDDISQYARASAYANLGNCTYLRKDYEEALRLFARAEYLFKDKTPEDYYNFSIIESWKGQLYADIGKKKKAMQHLINAYEFAKLEESYSQMSNVSKQIADFYAEMGDFKNAYDYQLIHANMSDKYQQQVGKRRQIEMEVKYDAEKKQRKAELLQLEATKLQMKSLSAQMNPHFMYNALNSIQNYVTSKEVTKAAQYIAKFAKLMRQSLEYSEREIISLEEEIEFLNDYLHINARLRFEDRLQYKITLEEDMEDDIMGVPTMIVQPYVENAIEHGLRIKDKGMINVDFSLLDEDTILCVVEDNGIGLTAARKMKENVPKHHNHESRGTKITEKRLDLLHHSTQVGKSNFVNMKELFDKNGKVCGTRVEIIIPVLEIQIR